MAQSIGPSLRRAWGRVHTLPGGKWLFSRLLGWKVPYTGTLGARVELLEPGRCVVVMRDAHKVRNHLRSVHAIALCNLGEMVTGLALLNGLPADMRGILTGLSVDYRKKARGRLTASCECGLPTDNSEEERLVRGEIHDRNGDLVAEVQARWLIGPNKSTSHAN